MQTIIEIGSLKIYLPDGNRNSFLTYGDLRDLFNVKWQGDAVKKLRVMVKELNLKPSPTIYYEENSTGIQSKSAVNTVTLLKEFTARFNLNEGDAAVKLDDITEKLLSWESPKKQIWKVGDVFSLKLKDDSFCFGQIVGNYPTVALFDLKKGGESITLKELENSKIITILHFTPNDLYNWTWKVLSNFKLLADKDSGPTGSDALKIDHVSFGSSVLKSVCDYHWFGIIKWEKEADIKELLLI